MDQETVRQTARLSEQRGRWPASIHVSKVGSDYLLSDTYIIESPSALRILLEPWMVGAPLAFYARASSQDFLRVAYGLVPELQDSRIQDVTEVVPLAGALYYSMGEAFEAVFGETMSRCFVGAKRQLTGTGWKTELAYRNFEAMPPSPVILIGDTIATGGTIESIVDATMVRAPDTRAIVIYSIAGGLVGAMRIKHMAERIGVHVCVFYANAIFGVESNGTDMPWLHPGTIASPQTISIAKETYGQDLGRRWCSIWDWGDRAKHPVKHLEELLQRCRTEISSCTDMEALPILERIESETTTAIRRFKQYLQV
jgi:hypothetical protein